MVNNLEVTMHLSLEQQRYLTMLPKIFTFAEAINSGVPKGSFTRLVEKAKHLAILNEHLDESGDSYFEKLLL